MSSFRRRLMMTVEANKQTKDYIQDGLVFHLDCADCDLTQNVWIDKKGNVSFAMSNVTVDSLGGVVFNGTSSKGVASVALNNPVDTSTIEVALNLAVVRTQLVLDSGKVATISYGFLPPSSSNDALCSMGTITNLPIISIPRAIGFLTNSVHFGSNRLNVVNGNIGSFATTQNSWSVKNDYATIGVRSNSEQFFKGTIYQIRIYNKHLTADEMIHNQQIDMRKYNSN